MQIAAALSCGGAVLGNIKIRGFQGGFPGLNQRHPLHVEIEMGALSEGQFFGAVTVLVNDAIKLHETGLFHGIIVNPVEKFMVSDAAFQNFFKFF